jgi:hypothetical protein
MRAHLLEVGWAFSLVRQATTGVRCLGLVVVICLAVPMPGDFALPVCGEHWARVSDGHAIGRLTSPRPPGVNDDARERLSLDAIRQRLRADQP